MFFFPSFRKIFTVEYKELLKPAITEKSFLPVVANSLSRTPLKEDA
jgi:P2-related tail formation protein